MIRLESPTGSLVVDKTSSPKLSAKRIPSGERAVRQLRFELMTNPSLIYAAVFFFRKDRVERIILHGKEVAVNEKLTNRNLHCLYEIMNDPEALGHTWSLNHSDMGVRNVGEMLGVIGEMEEPFFFFALLDQRVIAGGSHFHPHLFALMHDYSYKPEPKNYEELLGNKSHLIIKGGI